ncbi:MAG: lipid-A-disaccharide synthase [Leptolyngbyaceae cyanobacterium]
MSEQSSDRAPHHSPLHIFISTGEVSGDLQGSYLAQALYRQAKLQGVPLAISGLGGQRMAAAGAKLVGDTTPIGAVGILEALPYLIPNLRVQRCAKAFFKSHHVDLTIFLDYMGPNLAFGKFLYKHFPDLATAYYIAPQQWVWAFSKKDTQWLIRIADIMVAAFPQEAEYYHRFGANVSYFGHPLVDQLAQRPSRRTARKQLGMPDDALLITLLPASRKQELTYVLPTVLAAASHIQAVMPRAQFLVPVSTAELRSRLAQDLAQTSLNAHLIDGGSQSAIAAADLVLNKSGTVNLEVALMEVPQVVIYRLNPITARLVYYLLNFRVPFISPVNLLVNKSVVPEFVQWEATPATIAEAGLKLLQNETARAAVHAGYGEMRQEMGEPGVCDRVAKHLLDFAIARQSADAS